MVKIKPSSEFNPVNYFFIILKKMRLTREFWLLRSGIEATAKHFDKPDVCFARDQLQRGVASFPRQEECEGQ